MVALGGMLPGFLGLGGVVLSERVNIKISAFQSNMILHMAQFRLSLCSVPGWQTAHVGYVLFSFTFDHHISQHFVEMYRNMVDFI